MMRRALLIVLTAAYAYAADWVTNAGGQMTRDNRGQIVAVDLRGGWVSDSDLVDLAALPNLSRLDLSLTRITDHGLQQLKTAPAITDLNLYFDELIGDGGLAALKGWTHLKHLNLRGTKVTDMTVRILSSVKSLESLDIGYALITDVGLDPLTSLPSLRELTIGGNKLTDAGLQPLRQMTGLTYLDLGGAQRTDSGLWTVGLSEPGLDALATLKNLRQIRLNGTAVTSRGLEKVQGLAHLERLDLQGCKRIADDAVPTLIAFRSLRYVDLTATSVSDKAVAELRRARPDCTVLKTNLKAADRNATEPIP